MNTENIDQIFKDSDSCRLQSTDETLDYAQIESEESQLDSFDNDDEIRDFVESFEREENMNEIMNQQGLLCNSNGETYALNVYDGNTYYSQQNESTDQTNIPVGVYNQWTVPNGGDQSCYCPINQAVMVPNDQYINPQVQYCNQIPQYIQSDSLQARQMDQEKKVVKHIKKPLNAFMLYMKDVRQQVLKTSEHKDSTSVNQMIGKMWQSLSKEEQAVYFNKARIERETHKAMYPEYNPRDFYAQSLKKKRRKRDRPSDGPMPKKCRARFGIDQMDRWCKHCKRKKRCLWYSNEDNPQNTAVPVSQFETLPIDQDPQYNEPHFSNMIYHN